MAHEVVTQLLQLSKDPDHRPFMVTNEGCLPGLVMFLDNENNEVVKSAVETMHNLSLYEPNRDIMAKEPGLLYALHKLNASDYPLLSPTILAIEPQQEQQQQQPGLSLYSDKVATNISTAKTHTFYIKGMTNLTKHKVEETLVGVKGVISFLIDVHTHKAVVRTMTDPETVILAIKQAGLTATYGESDNEATGGTDEPDYLPEGQRAARKGWGWGSVVPKGGAKKQQEPQQQPEQGLWGWNSVVKAIWG